MVDDEKRAAVANSLGVMNSDDKGPCNYFIDFSQEGNTVYRMECNTPEEAMYHARRLALRYKKPVQINKVMVRSKVTTKVEFFNAETNKPMGDSEI